MRHKTYRIKTNLASQTQRIAQLLGKEIINSKASKSLVIGLCGELGAGKTTFVKGLAKGLGIEANITSPTFVLMNKYIPNERLQATSYKLQAFYHVDPYRLKDAKDILPELKELFSEKNAVIAIEWGERLKEWLPKDTIWITLTYKNLPFGQNLVSRSAPPKAGQARNRGKNKREVEIENDTFSTIVTLPAKAGSAAKAE